MVRNHGSHEIIAHRGYSSKAPENTLAAIESAIEAGADAVEWDVHVASCGTPVLFHDVHLGRTTNGVGPVRRRTLSQLQALDAGSWFSSRFAGERIPSLAEALEHVRGRVARVYCEIKGYRELEDLDRIVGITRSLGMLESTVFVSLEWNTVDRVAGQDAGAAVGYIVDREENFPEAMDKNGGILDLDFRLVLEDPFLAARSRARGVDVAVWTVNDPEVASALAEAGVTRFTTDEVETMLSWRATQLPGTPTRGRPTPLSSIAPRDDRSAQPSSRLASRPTRPEHRRIRSSIGR